MNCPICNSTTRSLFKKNGIWILSCESCTHCFADVSPSSNHVSRVYSNEYFQGGKNGYKDYLKEAAILIAHGRKYARLLERFMSPGTVLDVGCAAGFILKAFIDSGWKGKGVEPNFRMAEFAKKELGLIVEMGTLEHFQSNRYFDLVSMIQVVPHLFDLRKALVVAAKVTRPGGFWLIETWNKDSLFAKLLGKMWHEYRPPIVLHWFSPKTLNCLVEQFGFYQIAKGRPVKWISGAYAKFLLFHKFESPRERNTVMKIFNLIPDRVSIPYPAGDLFWALFKKSRT